MIKFMRRSKRWAHQADVSLSEAEVRWRYFVAGLQARGLSGVRLLISDDHAGLKAAREARFPRRGLAALPIPSAGHCVPRLEIVLDRG